MRDARLKCLNGKTGMELNQHDAVCDAYQRTSAAFTERGRVSDQGGGSLGRALHVLNVGL